MSGAIRIILCLLALPWPLASAAPWVRADAEIFARWAVARERVETLDAWRSDLYVEYGLNGDWTISGKFEGVAYDEAADFNSEGWRATARRRLFQHGNIVSSAEFGALKGAAIGGANGCETLGLELRSGLAWSGRLGKVETFAFGEVAGRFHDGCRRERYEFGFGQKMTQNIWVVSQAFVERGDQNARSDKIQTELLWKSGRLETSLGYRQEVGGRFQEESIFVAVAKHF